MPKAGRITRERLSFYSKPVFRACEILCNHATRVLMKKSRLTDSEVKSMLAALNNARIQFQGDLNRVGMSHGHVCAECKGHCCGGVRERDAFIDRILQYPETPHLKARRKTGDQAAYKVAENKGEQITMPEGAECVNGYCVELTDKGCRIPYELRPIQCTAYFCRSSIKALSHKECATAIRALKGLMGIQLRMLGLAIRTRFSAT